MNTFVNAYRCCKKNTGDEMVLEFLQTCPIFDADNNITEATVEVVGSFVMSSATAIEIAQGILKIAVSSPPTNSSDTTTASE